MKTLRHFSQVFDYHTVIIMVLAWLATALCRQWDIIEDMPTNLIGIAVVFPLVFSINSAYRRREDALNAFASFKSQVMALYYAHRDWVPAGQKEHQQRGEVLLGRLLQTLHQYFSKRHPEVTMQTVYDVFSDFSRSHELLREAGMPANEVSRANQYLRAAMGDFERMNHIANYQTPVALRAYSRLFLNAFPIVFAPFFASVAYPAHPVLGFVVAGIYAIVLVSLDNIQDNLENPYDGVGADDLRLDVAGIYQEIVASHDVNLLGD